MFVLRDGSFIHGDHTPGDKIIRIKHPIRIIDIHDNGWQFFFTLGLKSEIDGLIEDRVTVILNNPCLLLLLIPILEDNKRIRGTVGVRSRQVSRLEDIGADCPDGHSFLRRFLPRIEVFEINGSVFSLIMDREL